MQNNSTSRTSTMCWFRSFVIFYGFVLVVINEVSSSYEIIFERSENVLGENDRYMRFEGLRVKKFNKTTYVLNGKFDILHSISDSSTLEVLLLNWQGAQYKQMFSKVIEKPCEFFNSEGVRDHYERVLNHLTNPWEHGTCPLPTGPNEVVNFAAEDTFLPPYIPGSEKWMVAFNVYEKEDLIGGYRIYCILRNQETLLMG